MSCGAQTGASIEGKIKMSADWKPVLYLVDAKHFNELASDYRGLAVDSAAIQFDGTFKFKSRVGLQQPTLFLLTMQPKTSRFPNHLIDEDPASANYMPLVIGPEDKISINADAAAFHSSFSVVAPSVAQQTMMSLRDIRMAAFEAYVNTSSDDEENDTLLLEREKHFMEYAQQLMQFADTTSSLHAALVAIRWISPSGDYERMPEFIHRQCQKWQATYPEELFVKELCSMAGDGQLPVMVGDAMPDFQLPMANGDTAALSTLLGKKLTIVDIWASWCAPCRKENRAYLAPLYATYKEKGLEIIGYAIDAEEDSWKKAIAKDQAVWLHASHLTGDSTPFMDALRISTIPANFILDAEGKVVAKNVYGEELVAVVGRYLE
jgi:thiol-disulfide isomerase/thioredoxin